MDANYYYSCLIDFSNTELDEEEKSKEKIIFSDECSSHNRNSLLSKALQEFCDVNQTTVTETYLVKEHTQINCNIVFSTNEQQENCRDIFSFKLCAHD
ncbi:hypothetical protein JTB14_028695 [Gonioctena quinquepunctata]|nr:hypothetical protein JTB14_028695 [Gonioctena quinquepunctata]